MRTNSSVNPVAAFHLTLDATQRTIAVITATRLAALTLLAARVNSHVTTAVAYQQRGNAIPKTTAATVPTKVNHALLKHAPTSNSLAQDPATASLNRGSATATTIASTIKTRWIARPSLV